MVGAIVFSAFLFSTFGQLLAGRLGVTKALPAGCLTLIAGLALLALSLATETPAPLLLSALVGGFGQGPAFRGSVAAVAGAAPVDQRAGAISTLFVVAYTGISIPVIGVGLLTEPLGLADAGLVFIAVMAVLAASAAVYLLRSPAGTGAGTNAGADAARR